MLKHQSPQRLAHCADALVLVDVSPNWLYGHTIVDLPIDPAFTHWVSALAHLTTRLQAVKRYIEDAGPTIPIVAVEREHLNWLRMPRQKMTLALAGLYGDACVSAAADDLRRRGHTIVVVRDLCVWEEDAHLNYPAILASSEDLWPGIGAWVAARWREHPVFWDSAPLYTWE